MFLILAQSQCSYVIALPRQILGLPKISLRYEFVVTCHNEKHANKTHSFLSLLLVKEAGLDSRQILDQPPYYHPIKL